MGEMPALDVGLVVHLEDDTVGKFLLVGTQRADEVAEALRQHGDGAVDEIDTGGTLHRLTVDDGVLGDIV